MGNKNNTNKNKNKMKTKEQTMPYPAYEVWRHDAGASDLVEEFGERLLAEKFAKLKAQTDIAVGNWKLEHRQYFLKAGSWVVYEVREIFTRQQEIDRWQRLDALLIEIKTQVDVTASLQQDVLNAIYSTTEPQ
jgi:hypothetical protein